MKTKKYPIFIEFDQQKIVGFVELFEDTKFTLDEVLVPSGAAPYMDPETNKKIPVKLLSFGLIKGKSILKDFAKAYGDMGDILDKNCNV